MTMTATLIVKRYTNRKLYNTEESKYMTLGQLVEAVAAGRTVQVIENGTQADITGQTLLAAMVETETDAAAQTQTIHSILKAGGLAKFVQSLKGPADGQ